MLSFYDTGDSNTNTHMAFTHLPTFHLYAFFSLIVFCKAIFLRCINSTFAIIDLLEIHLNPGIYTIWLQAWEEKKIRRRRRRRGRNYDFTITPLRLCVPIASYVWHTGHSTPHSTHQFFLCMDEIWWIIQTRQIEIWSRYIIGIKIWKCPSIKKVMFNYFERFVDRKTHRLLNWSKWIVGKMYALGTVARKRKKNRARGVQNDSIQFGCEPIFGLSTYSHLR